MGREWGWVGVGRDGVGWGWGGVSGVDQEKEPPLTYQYQSSTSIRLVSESHQACIRVVSQSSDTWLELTYQR